MNFTPETIKQIFETTVFTGTAIRTIFEQIPECNLQDFVREYGDQINNWIMPAKVTFPRKTKPLPEIVSRFVSQDDSRKSLMGVIHDYAGRLLIGTDGKQMTYCAMPEDEKPSEANPDGKNTVFFDGVENLDLTPPDCKAIYNQKFSRPVTIGKLDVLAGYLKARNNLCRIKKDWYFSQNRYYYPVKICGLDFSSFFILDFMTAFMDAGDREIVMEFSGEPGEISPVRFTGKSGLTVIIMPLFPGRDESKPDRPYLPASGFDLLAYAEKYQSGTYWKGYRKIPAYGLEITGIDGNPLLWRKKTNCEDERVPMLDAHEHFNRILGIAYRACVGNIHFGPEHVVKLQENIRGIPHGKVFSDRTAGLFSRARKIAEKLKSREDCMELMPELWALALDYNANAERVNISLRFRLDEREMNQMLLDAVSSGIMTRTEAARIAPPGMIIEAESPETCPETPDNGGKSGIAGHDAGERTIAPESPQKHYPGRRTRGRIGGIIRRTIPAWDYSGTGLSFGRKHACRRTWTRKHGYAGTRTCGLAYMRTCLPPSVCWHGKTCGPPGLSGCRNRLPGCRDPVFAGSSIDGRGPPYILPRRKTCGPNAKFEKRLEKSQ